MSADTESEAWIDERRLGEYLHRRYGGSARLVSIYTLRDLVRGGHGARLYRRERFGADGVRIGPELKVPLETARLVLDVFEAAHMASLRVVARRRAGLPPLASGARLQEVLELLLEAGCDPPAA